MIIEKGKTLNGYAKNELKDSPNLVGGGYLTFFVSAIKNTIVKNIILNMYLPITTTSHPNDKYRNKVAYPPSFYTVFSLAFSQISPTKTLYNIYYVISTYFYKNFNVFNIKTTLT